jgi:hypothetical protein
LVERLSDKEARIKELVAELEQLKAQLPAHSPKPEMLIRIEEIEEEIDKLKSA